MTELPPRFPAEPVRDVRIRHVKQTSCGPFAIITVDFEPLPGSATGVRLAVADDIELRCQDVDHDWLFACIDALATGIREQLATTPGITPATRVLLRRLVIHPVDSSEAGFRTAGAMAARAALEQCGVQSRLR